MAISFWNKSKNNPIKKLKIEQTNENSVKTVECEPNLLLSDADWAADGF